MAFLEFGSVLILVVAALIELRSEKRSNPRLQKGDVHGGRKRCAPLTSGVSIWYTSVRYDFVKGAECAPVVGAVTARLKGLCGMLRNELVIDADTHINEPPDIFEGRLASKFVESAPRYGEDKSGHKAWLFHEGGSMSITPLAAAAGTSALEWKLKSKLGYEEMRPGGWDPKARTADMNIDQVDVQVMFPTYFIQGPTVFSKKDPELQIACVRAYNDWLQTFWDYAPGRFLGAALVPSCSIEAAIAEAQRVRGLPGIGGVLLLNYPSGSDICPNHPEDDPFWSALEELDLPLLVHAGFAIASDVPDEADAATRNLMAAMSLSLIARERLATDLMPVMCHLILGGVLERHPRLRVAGVEVGAGWVPFFLEQIDQDYSRHRFWTDSVLPCMPSEYWYRQCYITFMQDRYAVENLERVGTGSLMWSTDYPHCGADFPFSIVRSIEPQLGHLPADMKRKVLSENCMRLYGRADLGVRR